VALGYVEKRPSGPPADLRGRKVATRMGSTGEFLLYRYLAAGGLAPSDLTIVDLAPPDRVRARVRGDIDAFAWLAPFTTRAIAAGKDIKLITSAKGLANNRIVLSVTRSFAAQNPKHVSAVLRATHRATEYVRSNPEDATKIWADAVQGDVKQSLPV